MNAKLGQLIFIGIAGTSLSAEEKKFIQQNNISGVTLFGRNVQEPRQIRALCQEIQSLRQQMPDQAPLYIAIDMEGGRVARLKAPFTQWPPMRQVGQQDSSAFTQSVAQALGLELAAVGINVDWAPCADIFTNPANTVIGDRAFGSDAASVAKQVTAMIKGFNKARVIPCAKHFPGHGNTLIDSHAGLPVENCDLARLQSVELIPFQSAIQAQVDMVMTAHILYQNIDPQWPATLSPLFLTKILRQQLQYEGLIVTDDLGMQAMAKHFDPAQIPVQALLAGADLLLYCNEPHSPPQALQALQEALDKGVLSADRIEKSYQRVRKHKQKWLSQNETANPDWEKIIGCAQHGVLAKNVELSKK